MKSPPRREYRMQARAEAAAENASRILRAVAELWREQSIPEITLEEIARRAGVSVRTVIRRFGSRDGVIEATVEFEAARIGAERDRACVGDVDGGLAILLEHYERDGAAVMRTLAMEDSVAVARTVAQMGRRAHRAWCARLFAPYLPPICERRYEADLDAFVAATDLYLWKLLRHDLGRSVDETGRVIRTLVEGLLHQSAEEVRG
jgi:AcrR family transcriptional regulator